MDFSNIISTIDTHTAGEPTRIVLSGFPPIRGKSMSEIKEFIMQNLDNYRKALLYEPRGHKDMFGAILLHPVSEKADFGIIFMDHGGYLDMCGHGTIGTATAIYHLGMIEKRPEKTSILFDTPSGLVKTIVKESNDILSISLINVPSFLYESDVKINIPGFGKTTIDIAFGGNFFALVPVKEFDISVTKNNLNVLIKLGMLIKEKINQKLKVRHPDFDHLTSIELVEFYEEHDNNSEAIVSKNVVIFGDGQFDRSPCGTGTSAAMSMLYAKGKLTRKKMFINYSILDTYFKGKIVEETKIGNYKGIIPEINGNAYITGMHNFILDKNDPFKYGFTV